MVQYPWRRTELLYYLDILASPEKQRQIWLEHIFPPGIVYSELDYAIHFLFDDTALADDPEVTVGDILLNQDEVAAIKAVTSAIDAVLNQLGIDKTQEKYLTSPEWYPVIEAAKAALAVFPETRKK